MFIKNLLFVNWREKTIALIVTISIWVIVVSKTEETHSFNVGLNIEVGEKKVLVSDSVGYIHVQAKGNKFDFARITKEMKNITIDLKTKKTGKLVFYIDNKRIPFSKYLKITQIFPTEIVIETAPKISKKVSIEPYLDGQPKKGYKVTSVKSYPDIISISGPEDQIKELESIATQRIVLTNAKENIVKNVGIFLRSPYLSTTEKNAQVKVEVFIERDIREVAFRHVPVLIDGKVDASITPAFVKVTLKGPVEQIEKLQEEGFNVYVKNRRSKRYSVGKYYLKDLPPDVEPVKLQNIKKITIKKR